MYRIVMEIDGIQYTYGRCEDANRANEIAMQVRDQRNVWTYVIEE